MKKLLTLKIKSNMQRSFMLVPFLALSFIFLSCGRGGKEASGPVKIEFWYGLGGKLGEVMESTIKQFNESQNEVIVIGVQQPEYQDTERQLLAAVAANKAPATALLRIHVMKNFSRRGILEPLDRRIAEAPDFNKDDLIPAFLSYCMSDNNEIIALPAYGTTQIMYYRKDIFKEAGIDPEEALKNWQSLATAAAKLTVKEKGAVTRYGWELMWGIVNMEDIAASNGARHLSADNRTALLDSSEWVESWETVRRWMHEDEIIGIHFGGDGWEYWYKTIDDVMQGRAAGYVGSAGDQGDLDFNSIAAHIQPGYGSRPPLPQAECLNMTVIRSAGDAQKEAGFKWLRYFTSAGVSARFAINTGYIPVRKSCAGTPEFKTYTTAHPEALVPLKQAEIAGMSFIDFTGGKIRTALEDATDLVQIENVPAAKALEEANRIAQAALDEYWAGEDGR
jgi:multiple sugar transport system substrate-binding protein